MMPEKTPPEPPVTWEDLEARWREVQAAAGTRTEATLQKLSPLALGLVGVGLAALGGAYWLHHHDQEGTTDEDPEREPASRLTAPLPPGSNLGLIKDAVVRGLVEGLAGSGVIGGPGTAPETETTKETPDAADH